MATLEEKIASTIGDVSPDIVREVMDISNAEGYMFHGVKDDRLFDAVLDHGIKPLTPEGGYVSYWTSGYRLFSHGRHILRTWDTSFFHYAHSGGNKCSKGCMTLAISKHADLDDAGLLSNDFKKDGYHTVPKRVPRDLMHIIRVEINYSGKGTSRCKAQEKEKYLLHALHEILTAGYTPGALTVVKAKF